MKRCNIFYIGFVLFSLILSVILSSATVNAECVNPDDHYNVDNDIEFCSGKFEVVEGLTIMSDGVNVKCVDTIFEGNDNSVGITIIGRNGITVSGCTFRNFSMGGIVMESDDIEIIDNSFIGAKNAGLGLSGIDNCLINGNNFMDNIGNGITGLNVDDSLIEGNNFDGNTLNGIFMNSSDSNIIFNNDFFDNQISGLQIVRSLYNNITYNRLSNGNSGLSGSNMILISTNSNRIFYNTFENSGVSQEETNDYCFDNNTFLNSQPPTDSNCISSDEPEFVPKDDNQSINDSVNNNTTGTESENNDTFIDTPPETIIKLIGTGEFTFPNDITLSDIKVILSDYYASLGLDQDIIDSRLDTDIKNALKWTRGSSITKRTIVSDHGTVFHTDIDISAVSDELRSGFLSWTHVKNIIVFEYINKSVVSSTQELQGNFDVIKADPLMAWHFPDPDYEINISYSTSQLTNGTTATMLLVQEELTWNKWILPVIIIPFIIVMYIHFNRYVKWSG
ncbi:right-handed parallel beta-helix repeat-containing protein [Candidatus Woesearchaeota archaeon]|nr:right-handed parallel beta-helix repeat-containing protein [Candidatus Woesearchaeota archaeon]